MYIDVFLINRYLAASHVFQSDLDFSCSFHVFIVFDGRTKTSCISIYPTFFKHHSFIKINDERTPRERIYIKYRKNAIFNINYAYLTYFRSKGQRYINYSPVLSNAQINYLSNDIFYRLARNTGKKLQVREAVIFKFQYDVILGLGYRLD